MKVRKLSRRSRNRSAIAKKGWETRRQQKLADRQQRLAALLDASGNPFLSPETLSRALDGLDLTPSPPPLSTSQAALDALKWPFDAPFQVPPDGPEVAATADEDTAELDASNLTFRGEGGTGFRSEDPWHPVDAPPGLGPKVTLIKVDGESEELLFAPSGVGERDASEEARIEARSEVVNEMRAARGQEPLGPVRARLDEELEAYKDRIEQERAQERLQAQQAHAAALTALAERVLVQDFMGGMRGNADMKSQASHWMMTFDQASAVFSALERAGY